MDSNKHSDYDDMSPGSYGQDFNEKRHKLMKRLVSSIILLFVAASIVGIVLLLKSPDRLSVSDSQSAAPNVTIGSLSTDMLIEVEADKVIEEKLSDEQKAAVDLTKEAFTGAEEPEEETVSETGESSVENSPVQPEVSGSAEDAANSDAAEAAETDSEPAVETEENSPTTDEQETNGNNDIQNSPVKFVDYVVKTGDTVNRIAAAFGLYPETIVGVNEIEDINQIVVGSVLQIPDRDGQIYTVNPGDTLSEISYSFSMGYVILAEVNRITTSTIYPGDKLFIPNRMISEEEFLLVMNSLFVLPAEGIITIHFNDTVEDVMTGENKISNGIFIENVAGTIVVAAKSGKISAISFDQYGLGKNVVITHDNGYETVYGHLDSFIGLEVGDFVEQGEQIAQLGNTGRILEPMLYFEIRKDMIPVDPEQFF
ncbi:MAG: peptidoglycan DD-metalloendopeptidase family protein [Bacteroidetes bacterium]|nr:peptidoglycan DD-metalloendopeptidase family protein [Bacteroidota bacterium]